MKPEFTAPLSWDAVLLIAFGGPDAPDEIRPFLRRVLRNRPVPPERLEEVARHYEAVGGRSPLNAITFRQASALEEELRTKNLSLRVYTGLRHASPTLRQTLERMRAGGVKRALGLILSAQQTEASWERYQKDVEEARSKMDDPPEIAYCPGWHAHPLFIQVWTDRIGAALAKASRADRQAIPLVFTAHSIPVDMAAASPYVAQVEESCRLVAASLGHERWLVAFQSRSGRPGEPWLDPDVGAVLENLAEGGAKEVVVAPIGFVSDHVEVLYDLDIAARKIAEERGMRYLRATCPNDHPTFIRMMDDVIESRFHRPS